MVRRRINVQKIETQGNQKVVTINIVSPMPTVINYYKDTGFKPELLLKLYDYSPSRYWDWVKKGMIPQEKVAEVRKMKERREQLQKLG